MLLLFSGAGAAASTVVVGLRDFIPPPPDAGSATPMALYRHTRQIASSARNVVQWVNERRNEVINVREYNATADGVTDDTEAIKAAIAAAYKALDAGFRAAKVYLPAGYYRVPNGITLTRAITLEGDGWNATRLLVEGNAPAIKTALAHDGVDYYLTFGAPIVTVAHLAITGDKAAGSAQDGILCDRATTNPIYYGVQLDRVRFSNLGGSALNWTSTLGANAFLRSHALYIYQCQGYGMNLQFAWDTRHVANEIGFCGGDGIRIVGGGGNEFYGCNTYACTGRGIAIFLDVGQGNTALKYIGGSIDGNQGGNVQYDIRVPGEWAEFTNVNFGNAGASAPNTISDVRIEPTAQGKLDMIGCKWRAPHAQDSANASQYSIIFAGAAATVVNVIGSTGWADPAGANFCNRPQNVCLVIGEAQSMFVRPVGIRNPTQFDGFKLLTATGGNVAQLVGYNTGAQGGALILANNSGADSIVLAATDTSVPQKINFANTKYANNAAAVAALGTNCIYWNTTTNAFALTV